MRQSYNEKIKTKICRDASLDSASSKVESNYLFINKPESIKTPQMQNPLASTINTCDALVETNILSSKSFQRKASAPFGDYD